MSIFESAKEFEQVIGGFFRQLARTPSIANELLASNLIVRFNYSDPHLVILVDCSGDKIDIRLGDTETEAEVEMSMSADIAHKLWFGKVNLMAALAQRQMVAKGPVPRILKLLPAIKSSYAMYPKYLEDHGYSQYIIQ